MVRRLIGAALLTIGLGRLITAPVEAALLFATLAGARPLARFVADRTPLGTIVRSLPPIARYAVAAVLTLIVAQVTIAPFYGLARTDPGRVPEYFSVIVTMAIGLVLVELITTPATPGRSRAAAAASTAVVVVVGGGLVLVALAAPIAVLADDGAGLIDTYGKEFLAALAG